MLTEFIKGLHAGAEAWLPQGARASEFVGFMLGFAGIGFLIILVLVLIISTIRWSWSQIKR